MAQINWTFNADSDLDNIIERLAPNSETHAKITIQRIFDRVDLLKNLPRLGRVVPELEHDNVRELIVGYYRVVYHLLSDDRIDILTVHYSPIPLDINKL